MNPSKTTMPPTPQDPQPAETPVFLDEKLRLAWERYGSFFYILCVVIALGIVAKGGLAYLAQQREIKTQQAYAACSTPESFRQFVTEHPGHPLTALVELKFADEAYEGGKFAEAVTDYDKAAMDLPAGPFQDRAKLGFAISQARAGRTAEAQVSLKLILNDETQLKTVRCEAGYNLAGIAISDGHPADVQKLAEQLMQIDPTSPFSERTFALRTELAGPGTAIAVPGAP